MNSLKVTEKSSIAEKRAALYNEWKLAKIGNHEGYYMATIVMGIPDGDTDQVVSDDLKDGFYDDDILDTIKVYRRARGRYDCYGYYADKKVLCFEDAVQYLKMCGEWASKEDFK